MMGRSVWSVVLASYFAGVAGVVAALAVTPILPDLRAYFSISSASAGALMSVFAVCTLLVALPAGGMIRRWGVQRTGTAGLVATALGVLLFQAGDSVNVFWWALVARAVAGVGFGIISVAAPAAITQSVPASAHRTAMGVWATWVPIGGVVAFAVAPRLAARSDLIPLTAFEILFLGLSAVFWGVTRFEGSREAPAQPAANGPRASRAWLRRPMVGVAATFALFTVQSWTFNTWITTILTRHHAMALALASTMVAAANLVAALFNYLGGVWLHTAMRRWGIFYLLPSLGMMLVWAVMVHVAISGEIVASFFFAVFSGGLPTLLFAVPGLLSREPGDIASAMAYVIAGENAGIIVGPLLFGALMPSVGFAGAFNVLAVIALAMVGCVVLTMRFIGPAPATRLTAGRSSV